MRLNDHRRFLCGTLVARNHQALVASSADSTCLDRILRYKNLSERYSRMNHWRYICGSKPTVMERDSLVSKCYATIG